MPITGYRTLTTVQSWGRPVGDVNGVHTELDLLDAARAGNRQALAELVTVCLPLVYGIVRRGLGCLPDVDDVVQETMVRVLRELRALRTPESFRPWLMRIATRQVSTHLRRWRAAADQTIALDDVVDAWGADTEDLALLRLELSDQRRQVARAGAWLDPDDVALLPLWWLENAGRLTRSELASATGRSVAHTGVCVQRMRIRLESARSVVAVLDAGPRCSGLGATLADWHGAACPLWRKRILRHVRSCSGCGRVSERLVPLERLLVLFSATPPATASGPVPDPLAENCYGAAPEGSHRRRGGDVAKYIGPALLNTPKHSGNVQYIDG
jgi:RNA polymerase sigma factor (sigma-70 family)